MPPEPASMATVSVPPGNPAPTGMRRILNNLAHLFGGKAAAGLMSLIYLVIVTHRLGAHDYGVLVLLNSYAVLIGSVVAFSGFHGVVRYGTLALQAKDPAAFAHLVRFMVLIEAGCGIVAIGIAAAFAPVVGPWLGWSPHTIKLAMLFSLAVLGTVRATPQGILQVAGRFDLIGLHQALASPGVRLAGSVIILLLGGGLEAFVFVWLASSLAEGVTMWLLAWPSWKRLTSGQRLSGPTFGYGKRGDGFRRFIVITNFDITLRELAPNLAPLTVGYMLGPAATGLFTLAKKATVLLQQPGALLGQASYAVFADHSARGEFAALQTTTWRSVGLACAVAVVLVTLLQAFGSHFMLLFGGKSFTGGKELLVMLAVANGAVLATVPFTVSLTAIGKPQRSLMVGLVANLGLFPLLPLLLWRIGLDGAGVHAIIQSLVAGIAISWYFIADSRIAR